ncbi:hypothetical protein [Nostoc sp.]|uniref:hypothetical protein n=1 Tax=Nostoc sp. TaxID=1180 RepID=UPI002FF7A1BD
MSSLLDTPQYSSVKYLFLFVSYPVGSHFMSMRSSGASATLMQVVQTIDFDKQF